MSTLPAADPLTLALRALLATQAAWPRSGEVTQEPLPSSRPVFRFTSTQDGAQAVGKFFSAHPPQSSSDRSLVREYGNYLRAAALGLTNGSGLIPRLVGRQPQMRLGLLLEAVPGPDLDQLLVRACVHGEAEPLYRGLDNLAGLLAFFHTRSLPETPVTPCPALSYFKKLCGQLQGLGLLSPEEGKALEEERWAWEGRLQEFPDFQVLVHGDATPTNFLFPDSRVVALDLERLRSADRLWDLSFVAGELKNAWGWRTGNWAGAEAAIGCFFQAYLAALPGGPAVAPRLYCLNPFYMAMAELRTARNAYLTWDYRRDLIVEARRCLFFGRRM